METMAISRFKARCLAVLEGVRRGRSPVLITKFGRPVAEVVPPSVPARPGQWLGSLRGTARIVGDITSPAMPDRAWEVLRP